MEHFHSSFLGCDLEDISNNAGEGVIVFYYHCKTHNVDVCRCGWEFGYHFGGSSAVMKERSKMIIRRMTPEEEESIIDALQEKSITETAKMFNRSTPCIMRIIKKYKIERTKRYVDNLKNFRNKLSLT